MKILEILGVVVVSVVATMYYQVWPAICKKIPKSRNGSENLAMIPKVRNGSQNSGWFGFDGDISDI